MTDYYSELQALVDACESFAVPIRGQRIPWQTALDRARAALAEPEPPSLKEQALDQLRSIQVDLTRCGMGISVETIRRALEALPDD